jgi:NAD(P)-dependent dehydrogenase (short-subunit alcohol dehydrogenase family)
VNNAASGRICPSGSLSIPDSGWQDDFNTNFFSAVRLTAAFLPGMLERKNGAIVNISSGAALTPLSGAIRLTAKWHDSVSSQLLAICCVVVTYCRSCTLILDRMTCQIVSRRST